MYVTAEGKAFRQQASKQIGFLGLDLGISRPVAVRVELFPPNRMRRDLDNYGGKALLDAITHAGVWKDDSLVRKLTIEWGEVRKNGETQITIEVL